MNDKKLKELRKKAKISQDELAKMIGVDRRSIINYEKGEGIPAPTAKLIHILLTNNFLSEQIKEVEAETLSKIDEQKHVLPEINTLDSINEKIDYLIKADSLNRIYIKTILAHLDIKMDNFTPLEMELEKIKKTASN